jgi:hypothetical protein
VQRADADGELHGGGRFGDELVGRNADMAAGAADGQEGHTRGLQAVADPCGR